MSQAPPEAGWYGDPFGRFEHRYWNGRDWTENVARGGQNFLDPPTAAPHVPTVNRPTEKIPGDVAVAGVAGATTGGGSLFTEPVLVVNQKVKIIELNNEYGVYDANGTQIAAVRQVGQNAAKKVLRALTSLDQYMTHRLQIVDMQGQLQMSLTRPAKLVKSRVIVENAAGQEIGQIVQQNAIGKIRFGLEAGGYTHGSINAENWRAWNFSIKDASGQEVARITKTWEGLAKTLFTTADNYVVQIHRPLQDPLRSMVVASALSVDTALKQDSRGFG